MEPGALIDEVQSRVEDQKLRGGIYGPAAQDEEGVERPEGSGVGDEESQDDGNGVDEAAPGSE